MHDPSFAQPTLVACAFKDRPSASTAVRALLDSGVAPSQIGVGAIGAHRSEAEDLAREFGVRSDVDGEDPMAGAPGLASASQSAASINRGALIGGVLGTFAGLGLSYVPGVPITAVEPQLRALVILLLCFILGALAGATLGGAFAPQRSAHAAFRIVDEIEHGGMAVVVAGEPSGAAAIRDLLTNSGGLQVMQAPEASPPT